MRYSTALVTALATGTVTIKGVVVTYTEGTQETRLDDIKFNGTLGEALEQLMD